jgi:hypothetical protein
MHAVTRRRGSALLATLAALATAAAAVMLSLTLAPSAWACSPDDPNCVTVGVGTSPTPGGGSSTPPRGGGGSSTDPCTTDPNGAACAAENKARMCSAIAADWAGGSRPGGPIGTLTNLTPALLAQLNADLASNGCPPWAARGTTVDPATLAQQAAASFELTTPTGGRYPSGTTPAGSTNPPAGTPYTVVGPAYTWYWTAASSWHTFTATARAGGVWATATATPTTLSMAPGDGHATVSCNGPGSVWQSGVNRPWDPSPSGCQYQYPHSSINNPHQEVTATYTITWQLTWIGSGNTSGTLTAKTTRSTSTFAVAEVESVVTH